MSDFDMLGFFTPLQWVLTALLVVLIVFYMWYRKRQM